MPCPPGTFLLSCGIKNSQTTSPDTGRYAIPDGDNNCNCYNYFSAICVAWCNNVHGIFTVSVQGIGSMRAACPSGTKEQGFSEIHMVEMYENTTYLDAQYLKIHNALCQIMGSNATGMTGRK